MCQLLVSGEKASVFWTSVDIRDEADRLALEQADNVFVWLQQTRRIDERATVLVTTIFPRVLSDMLHCIYEALETSRKAKLIISFMLVRKPLQESLFLLESIVVDRLDFAEKLVSAPTRLWSQGAGGKQVHVKRIQKVLDVLGETHRFDAEFLAQLRYDKDAHDGFDGVCNKAIHLFTNHSSIQTEPLNINFIFSNIESMHTQWSYLYSRLPYLLVYIHRLVEHVCAKISPTLDTYLWDMDRRIAAHVLLWWDTVDPLYAEPRLHSFVLQTSDWLAQHCQAAGFRKPNRRDLARMRTTGAYPGEPRGEVERRNRGYTLPERSELPGSTAL
jgi:hypothetical protein